MAIQLDAHSCVWLVWSPLSMFLEPLPLRPGTQLLPLIYPVRRTSLIWHGFLR